MQSRPCTPAEHAVIDDTLYFGTATPDGAVTYNQWVEFLRTTVTPRFPQGLTVWPAEGQWRSAQGVLQNEKSFVLKVVHRDDGASDESIEAIRTAYIRQFRQDSVLRVRAHGCASF